MYKPALLLLVLVQCSWSYNDDNYPFSDYDTNMIYQDYEDQNQNGDVEPSLEKRGNSNFVRFGRARSNVQEQDPRPTRGGKMLRNDYFVRFGRSKQDYLRFGRDPSLHQRFSRMKGDYVRFGRSAGTSEHSRTKRETQDKRNSNFVRFGRNSNFLRFGRDKNDYELTQDDLRVLDKLRRTYWSPSSRLFNQEGQGCKNNA